MKFNILKPIERMKDNLATKNAEEVIDDLLATPMLEFIAIKDDKKVKILLSIREALLTVLEDYETTEIVANKLSRKLALAELYRAYQEPDNPVYDYVRIEAEEADKVVLKDEA